MLERVHHRTLPPLACQVKRCLTRLATRC